MSDDIVPTRYVGESWDDYEDRLFDAALSVTIRDTKRKMP